VDRVHRAFTTGEHSTTSDGHFVDIVAEKREILGSLHRSSQTDIYSIMQPIYEPSAVISTLSTTKLRARMLERTPSCASTFFRFGLEYVITTISYSCR
jgi:hypothetical protein